MDTKTVEEFFRPFRSVLIAADKAKRGVQVQCTERGADLCLARGPRASCLPPRQDRGPLECVYYFTFCVFIKESSTFEILNIN